MTDLIKKIRKGQKISDVPDRMETADKWTPKNVKRIDKKMLRIPKF